MTDYRVSAAESQEDQFTAAIEKCTSQIPSSAFLGAALSSVAISVGFKIAKKDHMAFFVGQWAAPFLILGIYNKLVNNMDLTPVHQLMQPPLLSRRQWSAVPSLCAPIPMGI